MAKNSPTTRTSRVFTVSFPPEMAKQVEAIAKEESRSISELFREAFRAYRTERLDRILTTARSEAAKRGPVKYTENDVEALVDEVRAARYAREQRKKTA